MTHSKRQMRVSSSSKKPKTRKQPSRRFELAPLERLCPEMLVAPEGYDRFPMLMLTLALVFNDLKGMSLLFEPFAELRVNDGELSGHSGEWHGLDMQIHRIRIGIIHELLALLKKFKEEATGAEMTLLLRTAPDTTRAQWQTVVNVALGKAGPTGEAFAMALKVIRNNVAFHYGQPKPLVDGYRRHFFESDPSKSNEYAYCSLGRNMESTRFYFADAAVQGALAKLQCASGSDDFLAQLVEHTREINNSLEHILRQYSQPAMKS